MKPARGTFGGRSVMSASAPLGKLLKEPDHVAEALGRNAAEADSRYGRRSSPATAPDTAASAWSRGLGCRAPAAAGGMGPRPAPVRPADRPAPHRRGSRRRIGPAGALRRSSAVRSTRCCSSGSFGPPSAWPNGKRHEERARRLHLLSMLPHEADRRRGDALRLERTGEHTSGVRAERSRGRDEGRVHALLDEPPADFRPGLALDARRRRGARP